MCVEVSQMTKHVILCLCLLLFSCITVPCLPPYSVHFDTFRSAMLPNTRRQRPCAARMAENHLRFVSLVKTLHGLQVRWTISFHRLAQAPPRAGWNLQ